MSKKEEKKESILNYVETFLDKRDTELRASFGDEADDQGTRVVDRQSIVIKSSENDFQPETLNNRTSASTDIEADEFNLDSDPIVETKESGEQIYKQQVYLRQYQPPTPEPIDIQVQEVAIKPQVQRPPIHVYVGPNQEREAQRSPSPIFIKSAPPEPPPPPSSGPLVYNKYVPIDYKQPPQQIIIHRYPEQPPKPRPIVVEQWLPNKPAPKRITYRHVNRDEFVQNEVQRQRNRYIEYTKPHTTIEVEYIRLPIITLKPEDYQYQSNELTRLDKVRSITQDPNTLNWRI